MVEFNARFGDPETQPLLTRLQTPLGGVLYAAATGTLDQQPPLAWGSGAAVGVVIAAEGYPASPRRGDVISGADLEGVFHAGTALNDEGRLVSAGGRVLTVVGTGTTLAEARAAAYATVAQVDLPGGFHRTDIAAAASSLHPGEVATSAPVATCSTCSEEDGEGRE